jgi:hypothetical protein
MTVAAVFKPQFRFVAQKMRDGSTPRGLQLLEDNARAKERVPGGATAFIDNSSRSEALAMPAQECKYALAVESYKAVPGCTADCTNRNGKTSVPVITNEAECWAKTTTMRILPKLWNTSGG